MENSLKSLDLETLFSAVSDDSVRPDASLDMSNFPNEKITSQFLLILLDAIADRLASYKEKFGEDRVLSALKSIFSPQSEDPFVKELINETLKQLDNVNLDHGVGPVIEHEIAKLLSDSESPWHDFLLFLGIAPWYSGLLDDYFGNKEDSLTLLLKSLSTGYIDPLVLSLDTDESKK